MVTVSNTMAITSGRVNDTNGETCTWISLWTAATGGTLYLTQEVGND